MGEWEQPVPRKFVRRVLGMLDSATIPRSRLLTRLDGPPIRQYVVEFEATRIEWQAYVPDDSILSEVIRLMLDAVERPVPVLVELVDEDRVEEPRVM